MTVLALTTSTPRASVALVETEIGSGAGSGDANGRVLAELFHDDPRGHAERVFTLIDDALAAAGRRRADLHLVACDIGPGSFTGVRIAVATAKGIALALGLPLRGVVSLAAMAAAARALAPPGEDPAALVAAAIDAKKDELYLALYDGDVELIAPSHLPVAEVAARLADLPQIKAGRPLVAVTDAAAFAGFAPTAVRSLVMPPPAAWIARLAARAPASIGPTDLADVVPLYVRAPDATPSFSVLPGGFAMLPPR